MRDSWPEEQMRGGKRARVDVTHARLDVAGAASVVASLVPSLEMRAHALDCIEAMWRAHEFGLPDDAEGEE